MVSALGFEGYAKFLEKYFIVAGLVTGAMDEYWTPCTQMDYERLSCSERKSMDRGPDGGPLATSKQAMTLDLAQAIVKGTGAKHMVVMKKQGIVNFRLEKPRKQKSVKTVKSAIDAMELARSQASKIYEGKRTVNIPSFSDDKQILHLEGDGTPGSLILITPESIVKYDYPDKEWKSVIEINENGNVEFIKGDKLRMIKR